MKKLLTYLTIALSLIMGFGTNVQAKLSTPQLIISMTKDGYDIPEKILLDIECRQFHSLVR